MVFENEINIYNPNAIKSEFHSQATQIGAVQGKIRAIISDSQITELQDGSVTMYDRLTSAEMDINGITTQVSSLRQADDQLESQISTIRQTASSISAEVTSVKNNYARKAQIIMAINNVTQESETQIKADCISLAGKRINLTSDDITINSTYFKVDKNGRITATAGTFSGELQAATGTFAGRLSAATGTFSGQLQAASGTFKGQLQAATGSFSGSVTATSGSIGGFTLANNSIYRSMSSLNSSTTPGVYIGTDGIGLGGGRFKVTGYGHMYANDVEIHGIVRTEQYGNYAELSYGNIHFSSYYSGISGMWDTYIRGNTYTMQFQDARNYEISVMNQSRTEGYMALDISYGGSHFQNDITCTSSITAAGTKSREVTTDDYGKRLLYCYETPSPLFGDVGEGIIAEDGRCYVMIDSVFAETISLNQYQVFLQKYGDGDCWVSEKMNAYFVVEGTPGMKFGWELKAKQSDFDQYRLERKEFSDFTIDTNIDYGGCLERHITEIQKEREVNAA